MILIRLLRRILAFYQVADPGYEWVPFVGSPGLPLACSLSSVVNPDVSRCLGRAPGMSIHSSCEPHDPWNLSIPGFTPSQLCDRDHLSAVGAFHLLIHSFQRSACQNSVVTVFSRNSPLD